MIVDSMNGLPRTDTKKDNVWVKHRLRIKKPHKQIVFIDEGYVTPDSYAVHYTEEKWWDDPMVRHSKGTNVALVDGHVEHWKWMGKETIEYGTIADKSHPQNNIEPESFEAKQDLYRVQIGTWSKLGYEPSVEVTIE